MEAVALVTAGSARLGRGVAMERLPMWAAPPVTATKRSRPRTMVWAVRAKSPRVTV